MIIRKAPGITETEIEVIVRNISDAHFGGNLTTNRNEQVTSGAVRFTLRVNNSRGPGARRAASGRRLVSANWEAHRLVMAELFAAYPGATLVTAFITYRGAIDFAARHAGTYNQPQGMRCAPVPFGSL